VHSFLSRPHTSSTTKQAAYDTFGFTAADVAKRHAAAAQEADAAGAGPSSFLGAGGGGAAAALASLLPEELLVPVADSIGIRLLKHMGWRQGKRLQRVRQEHAVRALQQAAECLGRAADSAPGAPPSFSSRAALLGEDLPVVLPRAKSDTFGLGFDPYAGAEEFRELKRRREEDSNRMPGKGGRCAL
jgi:G patch domain-containing protein 1